MQHHTLPAAQPSPQPLHRQTALTTRLNSPRPIRARDSAERSSPHSFLHPPLLNSPSWLPDAVRRLWRVAARLTSDPFTVSPYSWFVSNAEKKWRPHVTSGKPRACSTLLYSTLLPCIGPDSLSTHYSMDGHFVVGPVESLTYPRPIPARRGPHFTTLRRATKDRHRLHIRVRLACTATTSGMALFHYGGQTGRQPHLGESFVVR